MNGRVEDWKAKLLSYAGRVQLVKSILVAISVYWASMFIFPQVVIDDTERILNNFLWNQGRSKKVLEIVDKRDIRRAGWNRGS